MTPSPMSPRGPLHGVSILPSTPSHTTWRVNVLHFFSTSVLLTLSHWCPNTLPWCQPFLEIEKPARRCTWRSIPRRDHVEGGRISKLRCGGWGSCPPALVLLQERLRNLVGKSLGGTLWERAAIRSSILSSQVGKMREWSWAPAHILLWHYRTASRAC